MFGDNAADEPSGLAPAFEPSRGNVADEFARKQAEAERRRVEHVRAQAEDDDALDAFMEAEVLPDVAAKNEEARCRFYLPCVHWKIRKWGPCMQDTFSA